MACSALQGLDKFDKCETDEECGLLGGNTTDGPTTDAPATDTSTGEAGCGDVRTDPNHCGRCGNRCAAGYSCSAGSCTCASPKTTCGGAKADAGAEGGVEAGADASSDASTGGGPLTCVDLSADVNNCGACDKACTFSNAVAKCTSGQCGVASCAAGFVDCDGNAANGCECPSDSCLTAQKLCGKRVFTTSTTYDGNLGGLIGADAKCQARAVAAGLPGTYKAWLSDSVASPSTRFAKATVAYRLVDGTLIADNYAGLTSGTLSAPINKTESGTAAPTSTFCGTGKITVWTSTASTGLPQLTATNTCNNWTDSASTGGAQWGDGAVTTSSWSMFCSGGTCAGPTFVAALFCFQQ